MRSDMDSFGKDQQTEGPPYCRIMVIATEGSQRKRELYYRVPLDGITADVEEVVIHCTWSQLQSKCIYLAYMYMYIYHII